MLTANLVTKWVILFSVSCGLSAYSEQPHYLVKGTAYALHSNQIVYREAYTALSAQKQVTVDYFTADEKKFATKTLWYENQAYQPEFELYDFRDEEIVSAKRQKSQLALGHKNSKGLKHATIALHQNMVIDAGFDEYIRWHWQELMQGKKIKFEFAMPNRLSSVNLAIKPINPGSSPIYDKAAASDWVYFRLEPAKKWLSFFVDPIYLAYDANHQRLMRYHGRSNLDDDAGDPQDVRIHYEYFLSPDTGSP